LAKPLLALPPLDKTLFVIADAYPIIAMMQLNSPQALNFALRDSATLAHVATPRNDFEFFIQGWKQNEAIEAAKRLSADKMLYLLVDNAIAPRSAAALSAERNIQRLNWP
jgi:hypothetical protein